MVFVLLPLTNPYPYPPPTPQALEEEGAQMDELVSAPKMVLQGFIRNWFPEEAPEGMAAKQLDALLVQVRLLCSCRVVLGSLRTDGEV
jgi:hypothetical protein